MALACATGILTWQSAETVGTTITVSGLSFQPVALMFVSMSTPSYQGGVGFATSTTDRKCVGVLDVQAAAATDSNTIIRDDAVMAVATAAAAVDGLLDLDAITSDGFRLIVDDQVSAGVTISWTAWGGSDLVSATTGIFTGAAATGNVDYVVTGNFQPDVVLLAASKISSAPPAVVGTTDGALMFGVATGSGAGNQWVFARNTDQGSATIDADCYGRGDECLFSVVEAGGTTAQDRANFQQFNADGFRLNWLTASNLSRRFIYLALKGGQWEAGNYTINTGTIGNTTTVSGLPFQPAGAVLASAGLLGESAANAAVATARISFGVWSSITSRSSVAWVTNDATVATENITAQTSSRVIQSLTTASGPVSGVDIDAINSDGFRMIVDQASAGTPFHGYLAFGSAAVSFLASRPSVVRQAVNRSNTY